MALSVVTTYTGSSNDGGTGPTVTVTSILNGDTLVSCFGDGYGSATMTVTDSATGTWTDIGTPQGSPNDPNFKNYRCHAQLRAFGADTASLDVTYNVANSRQLVVLHLRGAGAVQDVFETALTQSGGGPAAAQALTSVAGTTGGLLVGMWGGVQFTTGVWSWGTAAGMTERADITSPEGFTSLAVDTEALVATGATGSRTSTATQAPANGFAGKLFSILAAGAPPATGPRVPDRIPRALRTALVR